MNKKSEIIDRLVQTFPGVFDADGVQTVSGQNEKGQEVPDPVPVAPPVGYRRPPTLQENIQRMIRSEMLQQAAAAEGFDTFEEAEDFDIEDDPVDAQTPYEAVFNPPPTPPAPAVNKLTEKGAAGDGGLPKSPPEPPAPESVAPTAKT